MEFLYLFILLIIAVCLHLLFKIKIEQSIFLTICLIFIVMFLSGLVSVLTVGYYILAALGALTIGYIIYKALRNQIKIWSILTPGFAIFVVAFAFYYFSTQGALLHLWDESTHWGTAAKKMFYSNELWTSGLQTIASPVFNQVMLKITGYKESALYLSQWVLYLSCIILPLSAVKWKKSYLAAIYSASLIFALSAVFQDGNLNLYADGLLSFFFASIFIAWHLEKEHDYKRYIWAGGGVFFLVQLKSGTGISLAVMLLVFMLLSDAISKPKETSSRAMYIKNAKTFSIMLAVIAVSQFLINSFEKSYLHKTTIRGGISSQLTSSAVLMLFYALLSITVILFIIYTIIVFREKTDKKINKSINKLLIFSLSLTFISLLSVLFYGTLLRPDFDVRTTVLNFFGAFDKTKILSVSIVYLIAIIVVVYAINVLLSKKEQKKDFLAFYISAIFLSGLYLIGVLYVYLSSFSLSEAVNMASFERYVGTALMFAIAFAFMPVLKNADRSFKKMFIPTLPLTLCAILLALQFTPSYTATQKSREEALVFRKTEITAAIHVRARVQDDEKVFLVMQGDKGFVFNWMRYEFVPITTNGGYWSFGTGGGWDFAWEPQKMKQFLHDANYDYLYLFKTNDYFNETFDSLFGKIIPKSKTLYKFDYESDNALIPVN